MFSEDDLLPISALQHLAFCKRQWGLMYLEGIWAENLLTVEGSQLHEKADEPSHQIQDGVLIARGLKLRSLRIGLIGRADVVEFHNIPLKHLLAGREDNVSNTPNIFDLIKREMDIVPFPVEYKHGKPKIDLCDEVQLCAQALCLEEMLEIEAPRGAIFYGKPRRRTGVDFDDKLRRATEEYAAELHHLTLLGKTPIAKYEKKCKSCSIMDYCLPKSAGHGKSARKYISDQIDQQLSDTED